MTITCLVGVHLEAAEPLCTPANASMGGVRTSGGRSHTPYPFLPRSGAGPPWEASGAARAAVGRFAHGVPTGYPPRPHLSHAWAPREGAHATSERNGMGWLQSGGEVWTFGLGNVRKQFFRRPSPLPYKGGALGSLPSAPLTFPRPLNTLQLFGSLLLLTYML